MNQADDWTIQAELTAAMWDFTHKNWKTNIAFQGGRTTTYASEERTTMIRAYYLYTGEDGNSHVRRGSVSEDVLVQAESIHFKETPPHSSYEWHNDPIPQYVITLSGVLEFTTASGETFIICPGDVLLATDHTGSGHKWRLVNDEPWKRAYVVFKAGSDLHFIPEKT